MKFPMKGYWATAFLLLVVQNSPVHAFKLDNTGHGGITRDALSLSITIDGETLKFTHGLRRR